MSTEPVSDPLYDLIQNSSTWDSELEKAREFAKEWNRRNAAGNLSTGFLMERGDDIDQLVKAFQELDRRRSGLFDAGTGAPLIQDNASGVLIETTDV